MERMLESFITLFVIMDPIGNLPLFISLTKGMPLSEIKRNAERSVLVAGTLLFVFLLFGLKVFDFFSINLNSFQIAGGIILLVIGIIYVIGRQDNFAKMHGKDLSIPIGVPLLTGPGVITTTIILVKDNGALMTAGAAIFTLTATWIILDNSTKIYKLLGEYWINVTSRIMGIILAAIAVDFIIKGILNTVLPLV